MARGLVNKNAALCALALITAEEILRRSHFCDFPFFASLCTIVMLFSCGLAVCKIGVDLYNKKFSIRKIVIVATGFCYTGFLVLRGQSDAFMVMWLFAAALHDVDFEKIIKVSALSMFSALLVVYVSSSAGFIDNTVKTRIREEEERNRNGVGFMEAYQAAYFLFFATLSWVYHRKDKLSWYEILTLATLNYVVFRQSDTRNPYYLSVALTAVCVMRKLIPELGRYQKWYTKAAIIAPVLCAAVIIIQGVFIDPNSSELMRELNSKLTARLMMNYQGVHTYGFSFFGKPIEWYIGNEPVWNPYKSYNWVDSVYLYSLLSYGVPFMLGFFAITTRLALAAGKKKDTCMVIALVLIAVLGLLDNYCFRIECNPFYLFFAYEASVESAERSLGERNDEILKKCA